MEVSVGQWEDNPSDRLYITQALHPALPLKEGGFCVSGSSSVSGGVLRWGGPCPSRLVKLHLLREAARTRDLRRSLGLVLGQS